MKQKIYSTKELADLSGIHPNTVRLYEQWGFIAKANRGKNNYRKFHDKHLRQMQLARIALPGPYPVDYEIVHNLVKAFATDDVENSIKFAGNYLSEVEAELGKALQAMDVLDKWFSNRPGSREKVIFITRKKTAAALGLTVDALRTWERNGLYGIPKDDLGRLRFSEWDIEKLMVIRLLRKSGFSIASLLNVFGNETDPAEKPSDLLSLNGDPSEITYITDRYIEYLEGHIERANKIIAFLRENQSLPSDDSFQSSALHG